MMEHCAEFNPLYCLFCHQYIAVALYLILYIDYKLGRVCYGTTSEINPWRFTRMSSIQWSLCLLAIVTIHGMINFCALRLRQEAHNGSSQKPLFYVTFISATFTIILITLTVLMKFAKSLRHLLKYLRSFESDVDDACHRGLIKPTDNWFHMHSQELKNRFKVVKILSSNAGIIFVLISIKYIIEVYRILVSDRVGIQYDTGQSAIDDLLLGSFILLFNTMLYASIIFPSDGKL